MTMNGAVLPIMAFYIVAAEEQGVSEDKIKYFEPLEEHERPIGPEDWNLKLAAMSRGRKHKAKAQEYEQKFFNWIKENLGEAQLKKKLKMKI